MLLCLAGAESRDSPEKTPPPQGRGPARGPPTGPGHKQQQEAVPWDPSLGEKSARSELLGSLAPGRCKSGPSQGCCGLDLHAPANSESS